MSHRPCPACGHADGGELITDLELRTPDGHPLGDGYPVVSCTSCGCGYADVVVPTEYYEHYYANLAKYSGEGAVTSHAPMAPEPTWQSAKSDGAASRIAALLGTKDARVLDLGCATGSLLSALRRGGFEDVHGVDPSPDSVRAANELDGVHAEVGTFADLPSGLGTFDCVCLTGVLEHLWEVESSLQALTVLLRPSGLVYVEVPDALRYLDPYVAPYEDFSTEHVNHFSLACLRTLGARVGLATVHEESVATALAPGVDTAVAVVAWRVDDAAQWEQRCDTTLRTALEQYAQRSASDFGEITDTLETALDGASEYILWGIGETAFKLLASAPLTTRVRGYVDSNPSRRAFQIGAIPVLAPEELASSTVPIIASSLIRADSIVAASERLGLANPVIRLDHWRGRPERR